MFFLENVNISLGDYRRKVVESRAVVAVVANDIQNLKDYLTGKIDTCPQLDLSSTTTASLASTQPVIADSTAKPASVQIPQISHEQMQEERQKHAALLEMSLQQKPSSLVDDASAPGERKSQKRKVGQMESFDKVFMQADKQLLQSLRVNEKEAHSRSTVLCKPGSDFQFVLKLFNDHVLKPKEMGGGGSSSRARTTTTNTTNPTSSSAAASSSSSKSASGSGAGQHKTSHTEVPIIVVPNAMTSAITILNVNDLLCKGVFISVEDKQKSGASRPNEPYLIHRVITNTGERLTYRIVDNPTKLRPEEWDRVAAVFVTGQAWQFKDWRWSQPLELFQHALGIHLALDSSVVNPNVLAWNCKIIKISATKRHLDSGAVNKVWAVIDEFIRLKKR